MAHAQHLLLSFEAFESFEAAQLQAHSRANELNPKHGDYDPALAAAVAAARERGRREWELNWGARQTPQERAARGRDIQKVVDAVREAFGGRFYVQKVGSRAKGTHLRSSDVDLKVMGPRPLTECDREDLRYALTRRFRNVRETPNIHKVEGEAGWIDVVPWAATYFTGNFVSDPPSNPFKGNIVAIMAVRDVKMKCKEMDVKLRGYDIEEAVLQCRQENPHANFEELSSMALAQLIPNRGPGVLERIVFGFLILALVFIFIRDTDREYRY